MKKINKYTISSRDCQIDHADENTNNWDFDNLSHLCPTCNCYLRGWGATKHVQLIRGYRARIVCVNKNIGVGIRRTEAVRVEVDFERGSLENKLSSRYEVDYGRAVIALVEEHETVLEDDGNAHGAEMVGCSIVTGLRYLTKLTNPYSGTLVRYQNAQNHWVIALKPRLDDEELKAVAESPKRRGRPKKDQQP
jgi:hypothetical protein